MVLLEVNKSKKNLLIFFPLYNVLKVCRFVRHNINIKHIVTRVTANQDFKISRNTKILRNYFDLCDISRNVAKIKSLIFGKFSRNSQSTSRNFAKFQINFAKFLQTVKIFSQKPKNFKNSNFSFENAIYCNNWRIYLTKISKKGPL